jgi:hypothetical protein
MSTQSELTAVTKLKPKRGEDDDDFRKRLVEAVSDLDDKTYGKLTKATRTWADSAIETFNDSGKVPEFDEDEGDEDADNGGDVDEEDVGKKKKPAAKRKAASKDDDDAVEEEEDGDAKEDESDETETEEDEDMTHTDTDRGSSSSRRRSVKKTAAKAASGGKKKVAATGRKEAGKTGGGQTKLKQILARDPDMSIDDLEVRLKKQGHEMSRMTLSTQRSGFRHTVKVLQEAGLLKKTLIS